MSRGLYRKRTRRRDHAQEALCRDLLDQLHAEGVETVYIGGLTDVLETHWSVETNAETHNFWAFKQLTEWLTCTTEESGISEAWTRSARGSTDKTIWHQDTLTCPCGRPTLRRENVPETADRAGSQADGTAPVRVGRPQLVGVNMLS